MQLAGLDILIIVLYVLVTFILGIWYTKRAGKNMEEYFVAGRSLPWFVVGTSLAVTWFGSDAPLAVAAFVRKDGIFGSWLWWYEAIGLMVMVFFFARLWRRSGVLTDAEFIELRYSGKPAVILRGFTALYHGVLRNCIMMGWVMLSIMKFSQVLLGWDPLLTLVLCVALAVFYTYASGLWGVVITDVFQFATGIIGSIILAVVVVLEFGGIKGLVTKIEKLPDVPPGVLDVLPQQAHLSPLEFSSFACLITILWLRSCQGDGYIAQRLFATKDEKNAILASFLFTILGAVIITWPWIIVGMGSLVAYPLSASPPELLADPELSYPMMLADYMPTGLKGMLVAAFLAAFMSTMDTHLCWGGSYLINDIYKRFIKPNKPELHYVKASRISIVILAAIAALIAWQMQSIERAWIYIIEIMAGIAVVWIMRWFWWRVNAWAEISSMLASLVFANGGFFGSLIHKAGLIDSNYYGAIEFFYGEHYDNLRAVYILVLSSVVWIIVAFLSKPTDFAVLNHFYRKIRPGGFWGHIAAGNPDIIPDKNGTGKWVGWFFGSLFIFTAILGFGYIFTARFIEGSGLLVLSFLSGCIAIYFAHKLLK